MRHYYVNRNARVGDTFGCFADYTAAENALRANLRSLTTHTIVRTLIGYIVTCRGY